MQESQYFDVNDLVQHVADDNIRPIKMRVAAVIFQGHGEKPYYRLEWVALGGSMNTSVVSHDALMPWKDRER